MDTNKDMDFFTLTKMMWTNKKEILIFSIVSSITVLLLSFTFSDKYTSSAVFSVNNNGPESMISNSLREYGGVASMIGLNLPSGGQNKEDFAFQLLNSKEILKNLVEYDGVRENIFAAKSYDKEEGKIIYDESLYNVEQKKWVRKPPKGRNIVPSYIEIMDEKISKNLNLQQDVKTGFISIRYEHLSPKFAYDFINLLVAEVNNYAQKSDLASSDLALEYLQEELKKTDNSNVTNTLNNLIESHMNIKVIATTEEKYLLKTIDPPYIPEVRSFPNRKNLAIIAFIVGFIFSSTFFIVISFLRENRNIENA